MLNLGVGRRLRGRWRFARLPWEGGAAVACVSVCGLLGPGSLPDPILRSIHTPAGSATQLEQASRGATTAVATLGRMVDAVNAADASAYAAVYAPDAVITIYGSERLEGRRAIERYEIDLLRDYPGTRLALAAIWVSGPTAVVRYGVNTPAAAGLVTGHEGLLCYRFNDIGEIAEERRYLDALTPMAQAGAFGDGSARPIPVLPRGPDVVMASSITGPENRKIVAAVLASLDAGDGAGVLAALADTVVIDEMMLTAPFSEQSGALAWLRTWTRAVSEGRTEITSLMAAGDVVIAETTWRGRLTGPIGRLSATGKAFAVHRAAVVRLRGGRITEMTFFTNGRELAQATGQWPLPAGK